MAEELADQLQDTGVEPGATIPEVESTADVAPEPVVDEPKKLSLRETIEKEFKAASKDPRPRDETGKFLSKDANAEPAPKEAAPAQIPEPKPEVQPTASQASGPPSGWSKESKLAWDSLPAAVKADAVRREQEVSKGFDDYRAKTARYQELEQVLAPARQVFQQAGVRSDAEAIKGLLTWESSFRNPATRPQAFKALAQQYGVDLSTLAQSSEATPEIPHQLRPVMDQVGSLSQKVSSLEGDLQRSRETVISEKIAQFSKDKPHFEKVRLTMGQMMASGQVPADDLDAAYQRAIWADPDIRAQLLQEEVKKTLVKTPVQRAQNARQAAISPAVTRPPVAVVNGKTEPPKGVRGSLLASIKQLQEDRA